MRKNQNTKKRDERYVLLVKFENNKKFDNHEFKENYPEIRGQQELKKVLEAMGVWFYIMESEFYHTVTVELDTEPLEVIKQFQQTPTVAIKSIVPLDSVVPSSTDDLIANITKLASLKINTEESFTVRLGSNGEKFEGMSGVKSPDKLTHGISRELCDGLSLQYHDENTDWVIQIEELGEDKGIAICRPDEILMK
jgi:tRNA acetyltransferase TAN1